MSKEPLTFGIIGIGGYAGSYLGSLDHLEEQGTGRLAAAVVRSPKKYAEKLPDLEKKGVKIYPDLESMLPAEDLDVVGVPTGIASHVPLTIQAMEAGCDVVCEKPLCATVQDARRLIAERDRLGKLVAIGYQRMFSAVTQEIKRRIIEGPLGTMKRARVKASWPRPKSYYDRNSWAAKLKDSAGDWVLDSPANNALAHYLQHVLFMGGASQHETAEPKSVYAELYRARDIENFDTCAIRVETTAGAEILYVVSHASKETWGPTIEVECENGTVTSDPAGGTFIRLGDAPEEKMEYPDDRHVVFTNMVAAVREGARLLCTPDNARQQTLVINAAQDAAPEVSTIDDSLRAEADMEQWGRTKHFTFVPGMEEAVARCYDEWTVFSEADVPWAKPGATVECAGYEHYPGGKA